MATVLANTTGVQNRRAGIDCALKTTMLRPLAMPCRFSRASGLSLLLALFLAAPTFAARDKRVRNLPERYQEWLEEVEVLISNEEREAFLGFDKDYQRDSFIEKFWQARDPDPGVFGNRFRETFYGRLELARQRYRDLRDDRFRIFLLNGEPTNVLATDCGMLTWPFELWEYGYSPHVQRGFKAVFVQVSAGGPFRVWRPTEGYAVFFPVTTAYGKTTAAEQRAIFRDVLERSCGLLWDDVQDLLADLREIESFDPMGPLKAEAKPSADLEWLSTFQAFSTDVEAGAVELPADLEIGFPGRHQSRVIVQGRLRVTPADAVAADVAGVRLFSLLLTGEVLRDQELFETFRYRFEMPEPGDDGPLGFLFDRYLRPGAYRLILKLEDQHGGGIWRREQDLVVPSLGAAVADAADAPGTEPAEDEGEATIELVEQGEGPRVGYLRFTASAGGSGIRKVRFSLEGRPILTKTRPPYSVELDVGALPDTRAVRVEALDADGAVLATDEILVNPARHAFLVRLVEPQRGGSYRGAVRARAEVQVAEGQRLDRVEFFLGDTRVATLFQPPFVQRLELEDDDLAFARAVAYLEDGNSTEDLVVFNSDLPIEEVEVRLLELFTTVVDADGRVLTGFSREEFTVFEEGAEQEILRFESLHDLPIHAALLIDTSASMADQLDSVRAAAVGFFEQAIQPRDRAAVITFSEEPRLMTGFTSELEKLAAGLAGLTAERGTALYDSLFFALQYFQGIKGQRALIVLSDGEDRRSKASLEEALSFAIGTGVTVYVISLKDGRTRQARTRLARMATQTGGRSFVIASVDELQRIYEAIQLDLRSRYLLVYQPTDTGSEGFRSIEVRVARPGARARTLRGYYP